MTKLEQMIKELCPEGVEYKKIGEVTEYEQPSKYIVETTKYNDEYQTPVLTAGQTFILGYTDEKNGIYPASPAKPVIIFDDFTAAFKWVDFPFKVKSSAMKIITPREETVLIRYLFHCMGMLNFSSSEHTRLWIGTYSDFKIPIPPLVIQAEVVRILDEYYSQVDELNRLLKSELEARKKQYEYYRDKLLDFGTAENERGRVTFECEWRTLGEISMIVRGASPRPIKNFITNDSNGIPWIKIGDVLPKSKYITNTQEKITKEGAEKSRFVHKGDFILSNSMSFGRPYILKIDGCIHDGWLSISGFDKYVSADYLYYALTSGQIQQEMKKRASFGGAVQNLNSDIVKAISIPIPPKKEQERIVAILDRFDKLCNDIYEGLPAEIEARKKQYEYYRDRLLSFKER